MPPASRANANNLADSLFPHGCTAGYKTTFVSKTRDGNRPATFGYAACYAGWLRLPATRPEHPTSTSPRRRLSLRRGEDKRNEGMWARKGAALPRSGAAEPQP